MVSAYSRIFLRDKAGMFGVKAGRGSSCGACGAWIGSSFFQKNIKGVWQCLFISF